MSKFNLYGSPAGSLICYIHLLKDEFLNVNHIINICNDIKKNASCPFNLYYFSNQFVKQFSKYIDPIKFQNRLKRIRIQTTRIKCNWLCIPVFRRTLTKPSNFGDLNELICASTQIPILSRNACNWFCISNRGKWHIDGGFADRFCKYKLNKSTIVINVSKYSSLSVPNEEECFKMYNDGINATEYYSSCIDSLS